MILTENQLISAKTSTNPVHCMATHSTPKFYSIRLPNTTSPHTIHEACQKATESKLHRTIPDLLCEGSFTAVLVQMGEQTDFVAII